MLPKFFFFCGFANTPKMYYTIWKPDFKAKIFAGNP